MVKAEASTTVDRPVEEVWRFVSDWSNFDKWFVLQPGEEINKTSDGPIALGSSIQLKGRFLGQKMVVETRVSEFEPNKKIGIEYVSGSFRGSKKSYIMEPDGDGKKTRLTHVSVGEFQGLWKILGFVLRPEASRGLRKTTKEELDKISRSIGA